MYSHAFRYGLWYQNVALGTLNPWILADSVVPPEKPWASVKSVQV